MHLSCCFVLFLGKSRCWLTFSVPKRGGKKAYFHPFWNLQWQMESIVPEHDTPPRMFLCMKWITFLFIWVQGYCICPFVGKVWTFRNVFIFFFEEIRHQNLTPDFTPMCQHLCILEMKENILGVELLSIVLNFSKKEWDVSKLEGLIKQQIICCRLFLNHLYD